MSKSPKPKNWLQYILDIPVCIKLKIFVSYHVQHLISEYLVLKTCVSHRSNENFTLNLCDTHLQKSIYFLITSWYLICKRSFFFPLNNQAFLVNSVARTWILGIFSCLSNSQIPYLRANSLFKKIQCSEQPQWLTKGTLCDQNMLFWNFWKVNSDGWMFELFIDAQPQ